MPSIDEVYRTAEDCFGDSLRVAASYDDEEMDFSYLRNDVSEQYTDEPNHLRELFLFEGMHEPYLETQFQRTLRCRLFVLEDAVAIHFRNADDSGQFLAIDIDGIDGLEAFLNAQSEHRSSQRHGAAGVLTNTNRPIDGQ